MRVQLVERKRKRSRRIIFSSASFSNLTLDSQWNAALKSEICRFWSFVESWVAVTMMSCSFWIKSPPPPGESKRASSPTCRYELTDNSSQLAANVAAGLTAAGDLIKHRCPRYERRTSETVEHRSWRNPREMPNKHEAKNDSEQQHKLKNA